MINNFPIKPSWQFIFKSEFKNKYMKDLFHFLKTEKNEKKIIYPKEQEYFHAFNITELKDVKVVIIGQDPYHGEGQAHGLCFSVLKGIKIPPSLKNIYKELESDLKIIPAKHGFLEHWAKQGVLLINSVLTVEAGNAGSHQGKGWERFTDNIIAELNEKRENIVFLLWGSYAQKKGQFIDRKKHFILEAPHPSPLSAHRGFFGCKHFSKTNTYLKEKKISPIDWKIE